MEVAVNRTVSGTAPDVGVAVNLAGGVGDECRAAVCVAPVPTRESATPATHATTSRAQTAAAITLFCLILYLFSTQDFGDLLSRRIECLCPADTLSSASRIEYAVVCLVSCMSFMSLHASASGLPVLSPTAALRFQDDSPMRQVSPVGRQSGCVTAFVAKALREPIIFEARPDR